MDEGVRTGMVEHAIDRYKALDRANKAVLKRQKELWEAIGHLNPREFNYYVVATEKQNQEG